MKKIKNVKPATIILLAILLIYTIVSFYKLGDNSNPQTYPNMKKSEQVIFEIESNQVPDKIMLYSGYAESNISISYTDDYKNYDKYVYDTYLNLDYSNVFRWIKFSINYNGTQSKYIMLESNLDTTAIGEIKLYDADEKEIPIKAINENSEKLIDEQECVPEAYSIENSSYFDEIYFPRAAYEILNKLPLYEYVHPPLGKLIMSIPMYFLGTTPFAYRLCGNIAGIFMILVIYLIAKQLFKRERYALFAAAIMALDGMHFVQTRIGTVDSMLVLFCLTSFLFFLKYLFAEDDEFKKKKMSLLISGTFWGMAISVKWTAAFVGLAMGILYLTKIRKVNLKILLWSVISFIIIPICIYVASYIPVIADTNESAYLQIYDKEGNVDTEKSRTVRITDVKSFFEYQQAMYNYHSKLKATHPYTSKWYEWPAMIRPMWYYVSRPDSETIGTIACMGNPAIWWLSIATAVFTLIYSVVKRSREGAILLVMILCTWLPYAFIGRVMFIYHYFITLPFMMLTIVFAISKLAQKWKKIDYLIPVLSTIFLAFFIYFYPVYSGMPVSVKYIQSTEWLNTWIYDGLARND